MSDKEWGATARLKSKVVMVVGATSGIGRAVSLCAAAEGAIVVVAGRRADLGKGLAADIVARGGQALFVRCDATVEDDVAAAVEAAVAEFGRLDCAVNNAGGVVAAGPLDQIVGEAWRAELDLNLTSVFHGLKHQLPAIRAAGGGAVVNNASTAGVSAIPGLAAYTAAKHGVVGLTRSAALEWAGRGVRVNALVTGNVDTPLYRRLLGAPPEVPTHELSAPNPTGRVADPREIAGLVAYLLSDEAAFITGAALPIDGGATAQ
ncbi:SDR family oxidoreductase [Nonomuraea angiospora]|uniref:SDR family oxidoreductase n=1 Tax=Nonomuraea angiospora TaxID=46172 RepID=UPI0029B3EA1C|nr:SDR family oxidoreductase [Nonomuraea angiospora]MDX3105006.1 SDR family oxidoreductase [Nonomuraea angiospora]